MFWSQRWTLKLRSRQKTVLENCFLRASFTKFGLVGQPQEPKTDGSKYEAGQFFLHRVFGYRGVILFPWVARLCDSDILNNVASKTTPEESDPVEEKKRNFENLFQTYYQVLVHGRDPPHTYMLTQQEGRLPHFTPTVESYTFPRMDHVPHEEVMPYHPVGMFPMKNQLFFKYLEHDPVKDVYVEREELREWREAYTPWLDLTDVQRATTEHIRVTVIPFYMGCKHKHYWWRYTVRLENLGSLPVVLLERTLFTCSDSGCREGVTFLGLARHEPCLDDRWPAIQFNSIVNMKAPSGLMWGYFEMGRSDGYIFECPLPPFRLESQPGNVEVPDPALEM